MLKRPPQCQADSAPNRSCGRAA